MSLKKLSLATLELVHYSSSVIVNTLNNNLVTSDFSTGFNVCSEDFHSSNHERRFFNVSDYCVSSFKHRYNISVSE